MAKNILIINGHPDKHGGHLVSAFTDAYARGAEAGGHEVRRLRLAELPIDFVRSAEEFSTVPSEPAMVGAQADITWANHLVVAFPLWLGSEPALVKAFFEQTLRYGFALPHENTGRGFPKGLLKGRSARLVVSMGMPVPIFRWIFGAFGVRAMEGAMLGLSGFAPIRHTLVGGTGPGMGHRAVAAIEKMERLGREAA